MYVLNLWSKGEIKGEESAEKTKAGFFCHLKNYFNVKHF